MRIAIVGHEAAKFTQATERAARETIRRCIMYYAQQLDSAMPTVVSGACPLGGVDIYAIEEAKLLGCPWREYPPAENNWDRGFKPRNIQIAEDCDVALCIVVKELPPSYTGRRFDHCYHCVGKKPPRPPHIKSGGCWTLNRAARNGAQTYWRVL